MKAALHSVMDILPGGALRRAIRNVDRASDTRPGQHWSVEHFVRAPPAPWIDGSHTTAVGSRTRPTHFRPADGGPTEVDATIPIDDEYSEWTDIFEAVLDAGDTFTFVDLGAGYGRWTSRAAWAARIAGKRFRCALAEPEPRRLIQLREHMQDNEITDYHLFEAATGADRRMTPMTVSRPNWDRPINDWYGQFLSGYDLSDLPVVGEYFGKPVVENPLGWRFMDVNEIPISDVLEPFDFVDLIDLDIQGQEGPAVRASLEALTAKVRRLHIETHSPQVEVELRETLGGDGWRTLRDYLFNQENQTPFGRFHMEGGVQTWINPRRL